MKSLVFMLVVLFSAALLVGCGGGGSSSSSTATTSTVTPPPILSCKSGDGLSNSTETPIVTTTEVTMLAQSARYYDLVIDNGRGTINNQDTEIPND